MILAVDIGNSTVVMGLINNSELIASRKTVTDISELEVNYKEEIKTLLKSHSISESKIEGAIISSVVPLLTDILREAVCDIFKLEPITVNSESITGIDIITDNPSQLGSDRIADATAGINEYGAPLVIIDMGTATTVSVINPENQFLGGLILPGVRTSLNSLINNTSQLPRIKLGTPSERIIGTNTVSSIENGIVYGTAAQIDGLIQRISNELDFDPKIIATGGNAGAVIPYCKSKIIYDKNLLLKGLYIIYKNEKEEVKC
ncbi:type III pantothenate kinase [Porcipelethomonas sp.]|uniref:type III pantothenate kinase n=1 Tax=Porcipelethomonas sp. TaxID=2981675 RepID=UPI00307A17E9